MSQSAKFTEYLKEVCGEVRWKRAHGSIEKELLDHLEDQKNTFVSKGMEEKDAEEAAVREMGDPVQVGAELNRAYRPKMDWTLLLLTVLIAAAGVWACALMSGKQFYQYSLADTAMGLGGGALALALAYWTEIRLLVRRPGILYAGFILVLLGMSLFSRHVNGQSAYASYLMLLFPLIFAAVIYRLRGKGIPGVLLCMAAAFIPMVLSLSIHTSSGFFIGGASVLILLTYAVISGWFGRRKTAMLAASYFPVAALTALGFYEIHIGAHRIATYLHPEIDPLGAGFAALTVRKAIAGACLIGAGAGTDQTQFLSNVHAQYLLTFLIERYGWISLILFGLLFVLLLFHGILLCVRQQSQMGRLIGIAVLASFGLQTLCFVGNNLGLAAFSEFPLPLVSGRVSMILNLFLIGCLLSVFRNGCLTTDKTPPEKATWGIQYADGKLTVSFK